MNGLRSSKKEPRSRKPSGKAPKTGLLRKRKPESSSSSYKDNSDEDYTEVPRARKAPRRRKVSSSEEEEVKVTPAKPAESSEYEPSPDSQEDVPVYVAPQIVMEPVEFGQEVKVEDTPV